MSEQTKIKQVIVMRTEYPKGGIRKGKMIAQACHASMMFMTTRLRTSQPLPNVVQDAREPSAEAYTIVLTEAEKAWIDGNFAKVCLQVKTEEELNDLLQRANDAGLVCVQCIDSGLTEFDGIPTKTCIAIGPDEVSKIDAITRELKLL